MQSSKYIAALNRECEKRGITEKCLINLATEVDDYAGLLLYAAVKNCKSFDKLEAEAAKKAELLPISRRNFYRKRKIYLQKIEWYIITTGVPINGYALTQSGYLLAN